MTTLIINYIKISHNMEEKNTPYTQNVSFGTKGSKCIQNILRKFWQL